MKRAPGTGGIRKLSGKRRKKYQAVISVGQKWKDGCLVRDQRSIGVYETKREAQAALDEYCRFNYDITKRNLTFEDVYSILLETGTYKKSVRKFFSSAFKRTENLHNMKMVDIRKRDMDIVGMLNADTSKSTQGNVRYLIKQVFRWAMENDVIVKNYSEFLTFPEHRETEKKTSYTDGEIAKVLKEREPIQTILLYTGMRIQELLNMKISDVYQEEGILCFHVTKAKTKSSIRTIPVHSEILDLVDMNREYVIEPHEGYEAHRKRYAEWNRKHGINHTFHELRHTFATYTKSCGLDDFYRRALLGHAQIGMTDSIYTDPKVQDLKTQIEKLCYMTFKKV